VTASLSIAAPRAFAVLLLAVVFGLPLPQRAVAAPAVEDAKGTNLTVAVSRDRIRWGEETEVTISAINSTGSTLTGGLYVSFDEDALVLEVKGGSLLRSGAVVYNLKTSTSQPITRPMVEAWQQDWKPGVERRVVITLLPIARDRIRIRARATFLAHSRQPQLYISPGRLESRALDEAEFPTTIAYVLVSRYASLRRAIRRIERRIRELDDSEQRRFASALAVALEDPKALADLLQGATDPDLKAFTQSLLMIAPRIAEQLKRDPLVALDNLRCLMASLNCHRALAYFGVPASLYTELSGEEAARLDAKQKIVNEKGGNELIALLEAEGFPYRREKAGGAIVVQLESKSVKVEAAGPIVKVLLERIIAVLGPAAERTHTEANGMSFARLSAQLAAPAAQGSGDRSSK
jgi:hypothetical protein